MIARLRGRTYLAWVEGVQLYDLEGRFLGKLNAVVDTGGGMSFIPLKFARDLNLPSLGLSDPLGSFDPDHKPKRYETHYVEARIPGCRPTPLKVGAVDTPSMILGRDFLSQSESAFVYDSGLVSFGLFRSKWIGQRMRRLTRQCK